jgi:glycerol-3-phosphate acyltransferase PlsY
MATALPLPAPETALSTPLVAGAVLAAYLVGAVPFGWLMARLLRGVDLRQVGSGNIGATNAMRVLGKPLGIVAFLLDFAKGWAPVVLLGQADPGLEVACGAAAVCGHVWPVYLRFKGGKAVATSFGAITGIDPLVSLGAGLVWLVLLVTFRYVSLASVGMGLAFPALALWRSRGGGHPWVFPAATGALALLILARHRSNISRILAGQEPRSRLFRRGAAEGKER